MGDVIDMRRRLPERRVSPGILADPARAVGRVTDHQGQANFHLERLGSLIGADAAQAVWDAQEHLDAAADLAWLELGFSMGSFLRLVDLLDTLAMIRDRAPADVGRRIDRFIAEQLGVDQ